MSPSESVKLFPGWVVPSGFAPSNLWSGVLLLCVSTAVLLVSIVTYQYVRVLLLRRKMPPGPFPLPIVGNHYQIPYDRPWFKFEEWSHTYKNHMITIWLGSKPVIVVNDSWIASDLLEKRADIYSSRPRFVAMGDLVNATNTNQAVLAYGDKWRLHRKQMHTVTGSHTVRNYKSFHGDEGKILTHELLTDPEDFVMSFERYAVSVVSIIGWGRRIARKNDYVCQRALDTMAVVNYVIPGWCIVDSLPWTQNLPAWIYAFPTAARTMAVNLQKYFYALNKEAAEYSPNPNFSKTLMERQGELGLNNDEVASLTSLLIGGGVDTTSAMLTGMIFALCLFPDVQAKAQAEIDAVIGPDRSPTWDDLDDPQRLPYTQALAKELLRWRSVAILGGIPHAPTRDDTYRGYRIPRGTQITCNLWSIHRNPAQFPDPDVLRPERYMADGGKQEGGGGDLAFEYPNSRGHNAFGWGRRQCPGQPLAERSLISVLARVLWAFHVEPGLDENGKPVKLNAFDYNDCENMRPLPFKARFTPRTQGIRDLIVSEAQDAAARLSQYDGDTKLTVESVVSGQL